MLPIWVMAETKLDQKYGVDLQNIYISGGARLIQTLVSGDVDLAANRGIYPRVPYTTEEQVRSILAVADHPKAAAADPKEFFDNRFVKELEDSGFIKELYGQR